MSNEDGEKSKNQMMIDWFEVHKPEYPNYLIDHKEYVKMTKDCGLVTGSLPGNVHRTFKDKGIYPPQQKETTMETTELGISETELRSKLDVLFQIREGSKKLTPGIYYTDNNFRDTIAKIKSTQYRSKSESPEFESYKGRGNGGIIYWGYPASIKKLKEENILS